MKIKKKHFEKLKDKLSIMTPIQKSKRLEFLKNIDIKFDQNKRNEFIILKFEVDGKESFFSDPFTAIVLWDSMFFWIENNLTVPEAFKNLFYGLHWAWLIDWEASDKNYNKEIVVREEIYENIHTIILPMLAEIEEVLNLDYKTLARDNIKDRIREINKFIKLGACLMVQIYVN